MPALTPVTIPELFTVATLELLVDHTPPLPGINEVVPPIQIELGPLMPAVGLLNTVNGEVTLDTQPVAVDV